MPTLFQINSVVNQGSTGRIAEEIGEIAIKHGWTSYIAYGRYKNISQSHLIKIGNSWDIYVHVLFTRIFDFHGLLSKRATRKLIHRIEEINPDIIHLHNIHGYYINYPILFKYLKESGIPVVWTLHDCWSFTGHCAYFESVHCEKWISQCEKCPLKRSYPGSILFDNSKSSFRLKKEYFNSLYSLTLIPVSKWLQQIVSQSFLNINDVKLIHNGVDVSVFLSCNSNLKKKYKLEGKKIILGIASPWSKRKGLDDMIFLSTSLESTFKIVLIGLSKEQLSQLPSNILGLQRTNSPKELAEWYSIAEVFVNPTYEDNFPTTNLESMSCGTPVVTYKTGGSGESIVENTGLIVEQGNLKQLVLAIKHIIDNPNLYKPEFCRQHVLKNYIKEDRYNDYINLYNQILSKK